MAKITYTGESDRIEWHGQVFEKGKAVTTDDEALIAAAQRNPFFATAAKVDAKTKAEIQAEERARQDALAQAEADAAEEAQRVLEANAAYGVAADEAGEDGAEEPASSRQGRSKGK